MSILLFVDDDLDLLQFHRTYFTKLGYHVLCASNARETMEILSTVRLDCVILDIDLPGEDGFSICQRLRKNSSLPVIFLSGLTKEEIRVRSFLCGGDDYLAKPYSIKELELRIKLRIQNRNPHTAGERLCFGDLIIDTTLHTVTYQGRQGDFTALQFDILAFLAMHPQQVFSYEQIYDRVWKQPIMGSKHNLQVLTATVRQKLSQLCEGKSYIETIPRKGYRFVAFEQPVENDGDKA